MNKKIFIEVDYDIAREAFDDCPCIPNGLCLSCILCVDYENCKRDYYEGKENDRDC